jgi:hypothetical protein
VTVTIDGGSIETATNVEVQPVKIHKEEYVWYGDITSDNFQPNDIQCKKPGFAYPGTRFGSLQECPEWCKKIGGVWDYSQEANNGCYNSQAVTLDALTPTGNPCCNTRWGLDKVCLQVTCSAKDKCAIGPDLAGCAYGPSPFDEKVTANTALALNGDAFKLGTKKSDRGSMIGTNMMHGFQYAKMDKSAGRGAPNFDDWNTDKNIEVILRSSDDPSVFLSKESKGCNTGKWDDDVTFTEKASLKVQDDSGTSPCFGLTPAQQAAVGLVFLILGCIGLIPPCIMVYMIKKMVADKKSKGEFTAP